MKKLIALLTIIVTITIINVMLTHYYLRGEYAAQFNDLKTHILDQDSIIELQNEQIGLQHSELQRLKDVIHVKDSILYDNDILIKMLTVQHEDDDLLMEEEQPWK